VKCRALKDFSSEKEIPVGHAINNAVHTLLNLNDILEADMEDFEPSIIAFPKT